MSTLRTNTIQDTGTNTAMTISGGTVSFNNSPLTSTRPSFRVTYNGNSAVSSNNVFGETPILVRHNIGSHFKTSGSNQGKFVSPVSGIYLFSLSAMGSDSSNQNSNGGNQTHFTKNGDDYASIIGTNVYVHSTGNNYNSQHSTQVFQLSANDVIGVRTHQRSLFATTDNPINPQFCGYLIG